MIYNTVDKVCHDENEFYDPLHTFYFDSMNEEISKFFGKYFV